MNVEKIMAALPHLKLRDSKKDGILSFDCPPERLVETARVLRDDFECSSLNDIASVDFGENLKEGRFGAVYHFFSHSKKKYVRLVCVCESAENPELPSICSVYKGADWHEREAYDLMGIVFEGHPNLSRILMWDSYEWHPLRKDFPLEGREASLPDSFDGNEGVAKVVPAPEEGGPFHAPSEGAEFSTDREPRSLSGKI